MTDDGQIIHILVYFSIFTAYIHSAGEGNVFTHVCLSVCPMLVEGPHVNFAHDALGCSIVVYKSIMG